MMDVYLFFTVIFCFISLVSGYSLGYIHGLFRSYNIFDHTDTMETTDEKRNAATYLDRR